MKGIPKKNAIPHYSSRLERHTSIEIILKKTEIILKSSEIKISKHGCTSNEFKMIYTSKPSGTQKKISVFHQILKKHSNIEKKLNHIFKIVTIIWPS